MKRANTAPRVALLLALAGCSGAVDTIVGPAAGPTSGTKQPDAGKAVTSGARDAGKDTPSGIGTKAFELCESGDEAPGPRLLRLLTPREYQNTLQALLYTSQIDGSSLPLPPRVRGYDNNAGASVVTSRHLDEYLNATDKLIDKAINEQRGQLLPCQSKDASCARMFATKFGLRAFRRPLSDEEVERYAAMFDPSLTDGKFETGLKLAISSMLISPHFLYRSEVGEERDGNFELTPYEVASALSYLYWGTMPDQALFDAAAKDELRSKDQLEAQARRLLNDQKAKDQLGAFSLQWLGSDGVLAAFKDKAIYPAFNDSLRKAMVEEQQRFINDLALTRDGKFEELFRADYVYANGELARFYGLDGSSNDYSKVAVTPESERGGLLGLGAVLTAHAHSNESSPVKRGKFVRDRLLCQDLPPPPANLDTTPPGLDPKLTTRARFAKHTASSACASCHQLIDGVGFGFEGFDGIGAQRALENGLPVDESGTLVGREGLSEKTSEPFTGIRELSELLADSASAQSCFALQYYRFARGYEETEQDACSLDKLRQRFEDSSLTVKELLVNLALLDSFTLRSGK
jgi:Protein of unknown function (DUF1592)/Protein of unknown function (DUF1588)/Protein of unknown function (DUF1595)/Protein of unknown function (DUF1585)/Protein of unknown function (DUF1587)